MHFLHVSFRDSGVPVDFERFALALAEHLSPPYLTAVAPVVATAPGLALIVLQPHAGIKRVGTSLCLGDLVNEGEAWAVPGTDAPDGSYALVRASGDRVEALSDMTGSRTLWFAHTEDQLLVSSSQRAIVCAMGSFSLDLDAVPWWVSSGVLPPGRSWDARVRALGSHARLVLNRETWDLGVRRSNLEFRPTDASRAKLADHLEELLYDCCAGVAQPRSRWILGLSGGVDSRAILMSMRDRKGLRCVTWGEASARGVLGGDVETARMLAEKVDVSHAFMELEVFPDGADLAIDRFVEAGEGRTDRLGGYIDGFRIWREFAEGGVHGILRGDEAFGWDAVGSAADVPGSVGAVRVDGLANLRPFAQSMSAQVWPDELSRRHRESLAQWRDRLYMEFRIPNILAALSGLKMPYVDVCTPLLTNSMIQFVLTIPDKLRTEKLLFRSVTRRLGPQVPYATRGALLTRGELLDLPSLRSALESDLASEELGALFPIALVRLASAGVRDSSGRKHRVRARPPLWKRVASSVIPLAVRASLRRSIVSADLDPRVLALRLVLATRTVKMFGRDGRLGTLREGA